MVSLRARVLAAPVAAALFVLRKVGASPASPVPSSSLPAGLALNSIAISQPMDLGKSSILALFRLTYQPGTTWDFNLASPLLVAIESGSLHLQVNADPILVARPANEHGQIEPGGKGVVYSPTNFPVTLTAGDSFSSPTGMIGATSNDGNMPVQLLVARAAVEPPMTEEITNEGGTPVSTP
jgi:hypothetical protein